jgi:Thiol:disulfide interchange protein
MKKYTLTLCLLLSFTLSLFSQIRQPVRWSYEIAESGEILFQATVQNGWHLYDMNLPEGGPVSTSFEFEETQGVELIGATVTSSKITSQYDEMFGMEVRWFTENPVFFQKLQITDPARFRISGFINYMSCNDENCIPGTEDFSFSSKDIPESLLKTIANIQKKEESQIPENPQPATKVADLSEGGDSTDQTTPNVLATDYWTPVISELQNWGETGTSSDKSWIIIFLVGFGGGLLALLTPCIWPIIPMTVSFFLKRAKTNRKKAVSDALTYGLSIIVIYLVLGLLITIMFGASALNSLSTNAIFNLLFFALLVLFAVSFFGAFELTLPESWTNKIDRKAESTTGLISIFFMAFTLALVSFSCTGPIIGTLLVEAASMGSIIGPAIGMFGFALALAIPFALFAIFPSWLQNMPKSGGWLNSVKVVLGFLELALALKFLSVADLAYGWGILDREVFLVLWIIIFALLGLYLLGKIKFAHDSDLPYVSVPRLFMAIISLAFAVYMIPGLWGAPLKAISAFSPPLYTQDFNLYLGEVRSQFHDYEEGMEFAKKNKKPVLIDFTGYGCVNCREMESSVWSDPRVKTIIDNEYVLISLYVDDKSKLPEAIEIEEYEKTKKLRTIGDRWSYLQRHKFGTNAQPSYILLNNEGYPIAPAYAYDKNIDKYIQFLKQGLDQYKKEQ